MAQAELGPVCLYSGDIAYGQFVPSNLKEGTEALFKACLCHKHKSLKDLNRQVSYKFLTLECIYSKTSKI